MATAINARSKPVSGLSGAGGIEDLVSKIVRLRGGAVSAAYSSFAERDRLEADCRRLTTPIVALAHDLSGGKVESFELAGVPAVILRGLSSDVARVLRHRGFARHVESVIDEPRFEMID
jgi:hypothetical protein